MEVTTLLTKLRDVYSLLRYARSKDTKAFLKFNKDRAIVCDRQISEVTESDPDTFSDSSDKEIGLESDEPIKILKENFRQLAIKGMQIDNVSICSIQQNRSRKKSGSNSVSKLLNEEISQVFGYNKKTPQKGYLNRNNGTADLSDLFGPSD